MSIFLPILKQRGLLERVPMTICNVGSRKLSEEDDYATSGWDIFAPHLTIYGFDADADACDAANAALEAQQITWTEKHLPLALSDRAGEATLYVTRHPMCSSLYPPNEPLLNRIEGLPELVSLDFTIDLETTTLDAVCDGEGITAIDFLQVDVQGADLNVLQGGDRIVSQRVLAIQIEVEFVPLYRDQPLFSDIDNHLRDRGFSLFDLRVSRRPRARSPIMSQPHPGQALWGEAFYLRDLLQEELPQPQLKTPETLFRLACVADAMHFADYALELLEYLTLNYGSNPDYNFASVIYTALSQFPELKQKGIETLPIMQNLQSFLSIAPS